VGFYVLGLSGPETAIMPPVPGVYFANFLIHYSGSAIQDPRPPTLAGSVVGPAKLVTFQVGGNVVTGMRAEAPVDYPTVLWAPTTDLVGGTVAVGAAFPFGHVKVKVNSVIVSANRGEFTGSLSDSAFVIGDPVGVGQIGWKWGDFHLQAQSLVNVPVGQYRNGALANLAFHRWGGDLSVAGTWHDDQSGWDVSSRVGVTFNGENPSTRYRTGTESHYEASVEKQLTPAFSLGAQSYYFDQLTGDSGLGNLVGPFKGRVLGIGGTAAYKFDIGKTPAILRFQGFHEFNAVNRLKGTMLFLDFYVPLSMKLPKGASGQ
jgi:hypothetical protein